MCTETGIKDVYRGVQGACPRRAVTHAGGTAERRAVGMGLKLVGSMVQALGNGTDVFSLNQTKTRLFHEIPVRQQLEKRHLLQVTVELTIPQPPSDFFLFY